MAKKLVVVLLALFASEASAQSRSPNRASPPCARGATQAEVEIAAMTQFVLCGNMAIEATFRGRVVQHIRGPQRAEAFIGVIPCPDLRFEPGYRFEACIGEPAPAMAYSRMDDFASEPGPRLYTRPISTR